MPITETRFKKKRVEDDASATPNDGEDGAGRTASPKADHVKGEVRVYGEGLPLSLPVRIS